MEWGAEGGVRKDGRRVVEWSQESAEEEEKKEGGLGD
jgi:hypothetical protein